MPDLSSSSWHNPRKFSRMPSLKAPAHQLRLRHNLDQKRNIPTCAIPIDHQNQFAAIPFPATIPEMANGVSAAKVVATIEIPTTHPDRLRPARK